MAGGRGGWQQLFVGRVGKTAPCLLETLSRNPEDDLAAAGFVDLRHFPALVDVGSHVLLEEHVIVDDVVRVLDGVGDDELSIRGLRPEEEFTARVYADGTFVFQWHQPERPSVFGYCGWQQGKQKDGDHDSELHDERSLSAPGWGL